MLNIIIALDCEASGLISQLGLKRQTPFKGIAVYSNGAINLAVSGIGKLASATATGLLFGFTTGKRNAAWLNIGIAGHANEDIGNGFLISDIKDHESGNHWMTKPTQVATIDKMPLITVSKETGTYENPCLYDMEASGFYQAACRFSDKELVQCYKVVSDNIGSTTADITKNSVEQLFKNHLQRLCQLIEQLNTLSEELADKQ